MLCRGGNLCGFNGLPRPEVKNYQLDFTFENKAKFRQPEGLWYLFTVAGFRFLATLLTGSFLAVRILVLPESSSANCARRLSRVGLNGRTWLPPRFGATQAFSLAAYRTKRDFRGEFRNKTVSHKRSTPAAPAHLAPRPRRVILPWLQRSLKRTAMRRSISARPPKQSCKAHPELKPPPARGHRQPRVELEPAM
jgi:hypothetical protein